MDDKQFDDWIRQRVSRHEAPMQPDDWSAMEARIVAENHRRRRMLYVKLTEVGLVLATVLTLLQFVDVAQLTRVHLQAEPNDSSSRFAPFGGRYDRTLTPREEQELTAPAPDGSERPVASILPVDAPTTTHYSTPVVPAAPQRAHLLPAYTTELLQAAPTAVVHTPRSPQLDVVAAPTTLPIPALLEAELTDLAISDLAPLPTLPKTSAVALPQHRVGMHMSSNFYKVQVTGSDRIDDHTTNASGYTIGVAYARKRDRLEWETGLNYSQLSYEPLPYLDIVAGNSTTGYVAQRINHVQAEMVTVPVTARYYLDDNDKTRLYATAGVQVGTVTDIDYDRQQLIIGGSEQLASYASRVILNDNDAQGLLEGGSPLHNAVVQLEAGMGLERRIRDNISFYVEPSVRYNLIAPDMGPNQERFSTFALTAGARIDI